jgi:hypothetical protein
MQITVYDKIQDPIDAVNKLGEMFFDSGMFGCSSAEQGKVLAFICISERKSPNEILTHNHLVKGRLARKADSLLAEFRARGGKYKVLENSSTKAAAHFSYLENDLTLEYTIEEAREEGLTGSEQYQRRPKAMLWARLITKMIKLIAPEIGTGTYPPEVVETFDEVPTIVTSTLPNPSPISDFNPDKEDNGDCMVEFKEILRGLEDEAAQFFTEQNYIQAGDDFTALPIDKVREFLKNTKKQKVIISLLEKRKSGVK